MDYAAIISWLIYQYVVSVVVGSLVIELIGSALAKRILINFDIQGITISLTVGAIVGFFLKSLLGL